MHVDPAGSGFPIGYFIIKSIATDRVLDIATLSVVDDTELILWPTKDQSLVESLRNPQADNQLFFIDYTGALCSRSSGHAIDVQGDHLVLRHRRPVTYPYPNQYSHPPPQWKYNQETGQISLTFVHPPPTSKRSSWQNYTYLLASVPKRKPPTVIDQASAFFTTAVSNSISLFSSVGHAEATPDEVFSSGNIDLKEDEILEEDRTDEGEVDDSPDFHRFVNVITVPKGREDEPIGARAAKRRQWEIVPLRATRNQWTKSGRSSMIKSSEQSSEQA